MIFDRNGRVRLTKDELNRLRSFAARNGFTVESVQTTDDLLEATILGLPDDWGEEMLHFIETIE